MTTTRAQIEELREQVARGKYLPVEVVKHPKSGESYAVILSPERDAILWAAGPLDREGLAEPQLVIDNGFSGDMADDADWLQDAFEANGTWL